MQHVHPVRGELYAPSSTYKLTTDATRVWEVDGSNCAFETRGRLLSILLD